MEKEEENVFKALGVESKEDAVTNAIVYAFNHSENFKKEFLKLIYGNEISHQKSIACARKKFGKAIPDICIISKYPNGEVRITIIENKLFAKEGYKQMEKYKEAENNICIICKNAYSNNGDHEKQKECSSTAQAQIPVDTKSNNGDHEKPKECSVKYVYLVLFEEKPSCEDVHVMMHKDLLKLKDVLSRDVFAEGIILDWIDLLKDFYDQGSISEDAEVFEKLKPKSGLDGSYLFFRKLFTSNDESKGSNILPNGLFVHSFFRTNSTSDHYYGAVISKSGWISEEKIIVEQSGDNVQVPEKNYNIHFELQYSTVHRKFKLLLHYETNPYKGERWQKNHAEKLKSYNALREQFKKELLENFSKKGLARLRFAGEAGEAKWKFGGRTNQIAKVEFSVPKKMTVSEFREKLRSYIEDAIEEIDGVIAKVLR